MRSRQIVGALMRVLRANKHWAPLPRVDIAILDTHCGAHLAKVIQDYSFFSVDTRGESFHIPTLIAACWQYILRGDTVRIQQLYLSQLVVKLGATICITNQDANPTFYQLDKLLPQVRFIALQQGLKDEYSTNVFADISGDYFAFGHAYAEALTNGTANMYVCGSIKANIAALAAEKHSRVCYISGVSDIDLSTSVLGSVTYAEFIIPSAYSSLREVDGFCSERGIELIIVSKATRERTDHDRNHVFTIEWNLYRNILGRDPPLVMGDSYQLAGDSSMVVCDQSALGYELLGRACKVVFINLVSYYHRENSYRFGWPLELPDQGPFWTNQFDSKYINDMLAYVWSMPADEWKSLVAPYQDRLMHYDPGNVILLNHIDGILNRSVQSV